VSKDISNEGAKEPAQLRYIFVCFATIEEVAVTSGSAAPGTRLGLRHVEAVDVIPEMRHAIGRRVAGAAAEAVAGRPRPSAWMRPWPRTISG
jgi:hypothetical protein